MLRLPRDWSSNPTPIRLFVTSDGVSTAASGLTYSAGPTIGYSTNDGSTWTTLTLVAGTLGTYTSSGFIADTVTGYYWLGLPTAALPEGGRCLLRCVYNGFATIAEIRADMAPTTLTMARAGTLPTSGTVSTFAAGGQVDLINTPNPTAVTAIQNGLALAATALSTSVWTNAKAGYLDTNVGSRMATYTQPTGFLTTSFAGTVGTSNYAGGDTAGTSTLLGRIPGVVQPQSGDSYAYLGGLGNGTNKVTLAANQTFNNAGQTTKIPATVGAGDDLDAAEVLALLEGATGISPVTPPTPRNVAVTKVVRNVSVTQS